MKIIIQQISQKKIIENKEEKSKSKCCEEIEENKLLNNKFGESEKELDEYKDEIKGKKENEY